MLLLPHFQQPPCRTLQRSRSTLWKRRQWPLGAVLCLVLSREEGTQSDGTTRKKCERCCECSSCRSSKAEVLAMKSKRLTAINLIFHCSFAPAHQETVSEAKGPVRSGSEGPVPWAPKDERIRWNGLESSTVAVVPSPPPPSPQKGRSRIMKPPIPPKSPTVQRMIRQTDRTSLPFDTVPVATRPAPRPPAKDPRAKTKRAQGLKHSEHRGSNVEGVVAPKQSAELRTTTSRKIPHQVQVIPRHGKPIGGKPFCTVSGHKFRNSALATHYVFCRGL